MNLEENNSTQEKDKIPIVKKDEQPKFLINSEQDQPPWEDFEETNVDENFKRKAPSEKQISEMNQEMIELGDTFAGAKFNWHLDGALNISFMNSVDAKKKIDYIGYHKDVDVSVEKSELAELEKHLLKKGYGLFTSRTDESLKKKIMKRVAYKEFGETDAEHRLIAAIDENGKIRRDKKLNFIDVHFIKRNEQGLALGNSNAVIPEKWTQPYPVEFAGGKINLSHPGKVLYYKVHQERSYDTTDIHRLIETGKLTMEDMKDAENVIENEFALNYSRGRKIFERVAPELTPKMDAGRIYELIANQPEFKASGEHAKILLRRLAEKVEKDGDGSIDAMTKCGMELFCVNKNNDAKRQKIYAVKKLIEDFEKIKAIKNKL